MARLPNEIIERIKNEVSLIRLMESQGHDLKKHGQQYAIRCPWHEDNTPSLILSPDTNLWHCKGCNEGGDNIKWVMKTQGVSFRFACEILLKDLGVLENTDGKTRKQNTATKLSPLAADTDNQTALRQIIDYYHQTLKQAPEAQEYLRSRGLDHRELIDTFRLGFANRTLAYRLPEKNRKAGAELRRQLQAIGILRKSGHEHFNGSLVVPVMDEHGSITEVYGRKINDNLRKGTPPHLYLPGPHEGVWNVAALKASREIILCESLIDAMTFWVHGFRNVITSYGTGGFMPGHMEAFKRHKTERVLIAYDRDKAGDCAAAQLAEKLQAEGIDCFRILFPKGMDANGYALKMAPAQKALALVIRKAEWMGPGRAPAMADTLFPLAAKAAREIPADSEEGSNLVADQDKTEPVIDGQATPVPPRPLSGVQVRHAGQEIFIGFGEPEARRYRVRGLDKNSGHDQLKIQLLVRNDDAMHMDRLDLYSAKQRQVFINQASAELGEQEDTIKKDLGKILLVLEEQQAREASPDMPQVPDPSPKERQAALALLRDPDLIPRLLEDFETAGIIGEETNKLTGYLACVSRRLDKPLAVMIQSSSAAGKSSLMESILAMMPEEERVQYSAMTGQSLFYMGETNLKHKILAIAEEEGASHASYALKLLQSEGEVRIASTTKDDSGNLVTKEYRVEGPVMLFFTTTAIHNDEELVNRCLVLAVDEGREQTEAIQAAQRNRRTLAGWQARLRKQQVMTRHQHAQRLIRPLTVVNPWANDLTFVSHKTRTRRDNEKYLTLIDSIALLHQYQREIRSMDCGGERREYIEVSLEDIALANRLAGEVLGRTLDELPPQTRKLLTLINERVQADCRARHIEQRDYRFTRRDVRQLCGWSETQVRVHLRRLVDMEYLLVHSGKRGQSFEYELLYSGEGEDGDSFIHGLIDVDKLKPAATTVTSRGKGNGFAAPTRAQRGGFAERENTPQAAQDKARHQSSRPRPENANGHATESTVVPLI